MFLYYDKNFGLVLRIWRWDIYQSEIFVDKKEKHVWPHSTIWSYKHWRFQRFNWGAAIHQRYNIPNFLSMVKIMPEKVIRYTQDANTGWFLSPCKLRGRGIRIGSYYCKRCPNFIKMDAENVYCRNETNVGVKTYDAN